MRKTFINYSEVCTTGFFCKYKQHDHVSMFELYADRNYVLITMCSKNVGLVK